MLIKTKKGYRPNGRRPFLILYVKYIKTYLFVNSQGVNK